MPTPAQKEILRRIRERGAVLDLEFTHEIYHALLEQQPRDGVRVTRDLAYGADPRHRLDVYQPQITVRGDARSVLIFFHGGGFIRGDKSHRDNVGYFFARQGYVVVTPNYRLAPVHRWPSGPEDVVAATEWLLAHCEEFSGDRARVFLAGESAGGAHVAAACLIRRFHPRDGLPVAGALLISGVYNVHLEKLARAQFGVASPDPRNEAYFGSDFERYPAMSTVELIDAPAMPLFVSYAELDLLQMQVQAGELFARLICRHGFSPELHVVPDHNHLTQVYAINTGDESLSGRMLKFLQRHAGPQTLKPERSTA